MTTIRKIFAVAVLMTLFACGTSDERRVDTGVRNDVGVQNDVGAADVPYVPCPLTNGFSCGVGTCPKEGSFCIIDPGGQITAPRCISIDCHILTECSDALANLPGTCTDPQCDGDSFTGVTVTCR